jgi:hypothetical protein
MIWSKVAIDYSAGTYNHPDGTIRANKIGCWVMTVEEAKASFAPIH